MDSNEILALRCSKGLTQDKLASALGLHRTTVLGWERGTIHISARNEAKLRDCLGMTAPQTSSIPPSMSPEDLIALRTGKGMSQADLADKIGVTKLTILRWEKGRTPISRKYELSIRALFTDASNNDAQRRAIVLEKSLRAILTMDNVDRIHGYVEAILQGNC